MPCGLKKLRENNLAYAKIIIFVVVVLIFSAMSSPWLSINQSLKVNVAFLKEDMQCECKGNDSEKFLPLSFLHFFDQCWMI